AEVTSSATSLEDFLALPELEGIAAARLETFYEAGIQSVADFANHTEKELLALKGIGPATIKQLKEKGIELKA
ncbi:helix-hairpin-helix domain-containing protein, partial [Streptococcus suis]